MAQISDLSDRFGIVSSPASGSHRLSPVSVLMRALDGLRWTSKYLTLRAFPVRVIVLYVDIKVERNY